jgi:hypothetical protein
VIADRIARFTQSSRSPGRIIQLPPSWRAPQTGQEARVMRGSIRIQGMPAPAQISQIPSEGLPQRGQKVSRMLMDQIR